MKVLSRIVQTVMGAALFDLGHRQIHDSGCAPWCMIAEI